MLEIYRTIYVLAQIFQCSPFQFQPMIVSLREAVGGGQPNAAPSAADAAAFQALPGFDTGNDGLLLVDINAQIIQKATGGQQQDGTPQIAPQSGSNAFRQQFYSNTTPINSNISADNKLFLGQIINANRSLRVKTVFANSNSAPSNVSEVVTNITGLIVPTMLLEKATMLQPLIIEKKNF